MVDLIGPNDLDDHQGQQIVIPGQVSLIAMAASESLDRHTPGSDLVTLLEVSVGFHLSPLSMDFSGRLGPAPHGLDSSAGVVAGAIVGAVGAPVPLLATLAVASLVSGVVSAASVTVSAHSGVATAGAIVAVDTTCEASAVVIPVVVIVVIVVGERDNLSGVFFPFCRKIVIPCAVRKGDAERSEGKQGGEHEDRRPC